MTDFIVMIILACKRTRTFVLSSSRITQLKNCYCTSVMRLENENIYSSFMFTCFSSFRLEQLCDPRRGEKKCFGNLLIVIEGLHMIHSLSVGLAGKKIKLKFNGRRAGKKHIFKHLRREISIRSCRLNKVSSSN